MKAVECSTECQRAFGRDRICQIQFIMIHLEFQEFLPIRCEVNFVPHSDDRLPRQTLANRMRGLVVSKNQFKVSVLRSEGVRHRVVFALPS
jgi:hypothetical protein